MQLNIKITNDLIKKKSGGRNPKQTDIDKRRYTEA